MSSHVHFPLVLNSSLFCEWMIIYLAIYQLKAEGHPDCFQILAMKNKIGFIHVFVWP
jgi:hypothetical protein